MSGPPTNNKVTSVRRSVAYMPGENSNSFQGTSTVEAYEASLIEKYGPWEEKYKDLHGNQFYSWGKTGPRDYMLKVHLHVTGARSKLPGVVIQAAFHLSDSNLGG